MEIVFCTVVIAEFENVTVVTQTLFCDTNDLTKFDFMLKEHCHRSKYSQRLPVYNSGVLVCFKSPLTCLLCRILEVR